MSTERPSGRRRTRVVAALAGFAIAFGGVAASAPAAVAAPNAVASASQTYDVGVYLYPECAARGQYYAAYYSAQGYRVYVQCLYVGGFPIQQFLLRVTLALRS
ncbi:hypothetical protein AADR41_17995 [Streptomyces sp. CLV115]|uniref:hypothetical protein n=1 Tax=Streptomyces sp. CLV115 TaxID=3138502 RepID=UPI00313E71CD